MLSTRAAVASGQRVPIRDAVLRMARFADNRDALNQNFALSAGDSVRRLREASAGV